MRLSILTRWMVLTGVLLIVLATCLGLLVHWQVIVDGDGEVLEEFVESRRSWGTPTVQLFTSLFNPLAAVIVSLLVGIAATLRFRQWRVFAYMAAVMVLSTAITQGLKHAFVRNRPAVMWHLVEETDFSFPSGHSTAAVALSSAVIVVWVMLSAKWKPVAVVAVAAAVIAIGIPASRLYLGVHWFTDTAAGAMVGLGTALLVSPLLPRTGVMVSHWPSRLRRWMTDKGKHARQLR
ncbi:phosphatase PAP2 family protein [Corynebacterium choanae]|uniref:Undecaprenyl pyrophosphate phosphatase n=1 Tax=Corynebacterium choanae TaxID=1862358 RepID=A0A3G6J8Z8_9CORY|nr:phosphatase PAP2 family protein [Corynebacterium choanae]AZA12494.1 undecaprenyl pyrophosphate phosphatase [Corynebacterium choanae]